MPFLTIHHLAGESRELLARKRRHFDPVIEPLAKKHGALLSLTAVAEDGLVIINLWETPAGAAGLREEPDAVQAQQRAQLPRPSRFEQYEDVELDEFR